MTYLIDLVGRKWALSIHCPIDIKGNFFGMSFEFIGMSLGISGDNKICCAPFRASGKLFGKLITVRKNFLDSSSNFIFTVPDILPLDFFGVSLPAGIAKGFDFLNIR